MIFTYLVILPICVLLTEFSFYNWFISIMENAIQQMHLIRELSALRNQLEDYKLEAKYASIIKNELPVREDVSAECLKDSLQKIAYLNNEFSTAEVRLSDLLTSTSLKLNHDQKKELVSIVKTIMQIIADLKMDYYSDIYNLLQTSFHRLECFLNNHSDTSTYLSTIHSILEEIKTFAKQIL